jgi:hypothetical protein
MNIRALAVAAVAGTVALFVWQGLSESVLPWHAATMVEMSDTTASAVSAVRAIAPDNGVYFSRYGALMAVRIAPDNSDQTRSIGPMMIRQAAVDFLVVAALCLLATLLYDQSPLGIAKVMAIAGFAMIVVQEMSMVIWYGFTAAWAAVNIADQTISFFLTGLVIGAVFKRLGVTAAVAIPQGQGYRTSGGRATVGR